MIFWSGLTLFLYRSMALVFVGKIRLEEVLGNGLLGPRVVIPVIEDSLRQFTYKEDVIAYPVKRGFMVKVMGQESYRRVSLHLDERKFVVGFNSFKVVSRSESQEHPLAWCRIEM